jgi:tripartite-type tricarboxylate transporter receptor subunit TctC
MGLFAPARVPAAVVERLRGATLRALDNADVRRRLEATGWRVMVMGADETRAFVKREAEKWPAILRQAGLQPD